jgi:hypothetical protein
MMPTYWQTSEEMPVSLVGVFSCHVDHLPCLCPFGSAAVI